MTKNTTFASRFGLALCVAAMISTSAFAEIRHSRGDWRQNHARGRQPYFAHGRVTRYERFGGVGYPYYDGACDGPVYTSGGLRGVVESVDERRGRLIVHDDVSGAFVTVVMRGDDRRLRDVRLGDVIDLSGDWTRTGVFEAHRVDAIDSQGSFYR